MNDLLAQRKMNAINVQCIIRSLDADSALQIRFAHRRSVCALCTPPERVCINASTVHMQHRLPEKQHEHPPMRICPGASSEQDEGRQLG